MCVQYFVHFAAWVNIFKTGSMFNSLNQLFAAGLQCSSPLAVSIGQLNPFPERCHPLCWLHGSTSNVCQSLNFFPDFSCSLHEMSQHQSQDYFICP